MTNPLAKSKKLAKFLCNVLGRHPDEFGLVPDPEGFVSTKTLLKALHEEAGWRHVRMAHLNEIITTLAPAPVEIQAGRMRAVDRSRLPRAEPSRQLPKLLYTAVRWRAYDAVMDHGVKAPDDAGLVLSADRDMALRLGRRIDNPPLVLTVQVAQSLSKGTRYHRYGEHLYLANAVAPGTFSIPPRPRERAQPARRKETAPPTVPKTPGSYLPELSEFQEGPPKSAGAKRRDKADWKKARRQARRLKSRQQR